MRLFIFILLLSFYSSAQPDRPEISLMVGDATTHTRIEIPICVTPDTLLISPIYKGRVLGFHIIEFIVDDEQGEKTYFATYDFNWNTIHCLLITNNTDFIKEEYFFYSAIEIKVESIYFREEFNKYGMPIPADILRKTMKSIELTENGQFHVVKEERML